MAGPRLSVVLVTDEGGRGLDRILARLAAQTIARDIEVVIGAAAPETLVLPPEPASAFGDVRVIAVDTTTSARARAPAVRTATAPIVALAEDHSFPEGDRWAEHLLEGFEAGHAAVGPVVRNANPGTRISRANLAVEYAPWMAADSPRVVDTVPGHNSAYRLDLLLAYGDRLADMLEAEWVLHADLRRQGHTLLLDPRIEVAHLNYSLAARSVRLQFLSGRMFAASRSAAWAPGRRMLYALASPAIPVRRFCAIAGNLLPAAETRSQMLGALPMTALLLAASAMGEGLGYAFGDGGRRSALAQMEYRRWRNMRPDEEHLAR